MGQYNTEKFIEIFRKMNKFDIDQGLKFEVESPGNIIYQMKIVEKHLSSPNTAHGGALAGFMDCVLGLSALSLAIVEDNLTSTVEFKINFIRPANLHEEIIGTGKVIHKGKSLIISAGEIKNTHGQLVAVGQGTFNTYPFSKKDYLYELTNPS